MAKQKIKNLFEANRKRVQQSLYDSEFIEILTQDALPYTVVEKHNLDENGDLRDDKKLTYLVLENIPAKEDAIRPSSWVVHLEPEDGEKKSPFAMPPKFKTVEKAFIFYTLNCMYVLLVEMKNTLHPHGESGMETLTQKITDTITRINTLLTVHYYDDRYEQTELKYKAIIIYNNTFDNSIFEKDEELARLPLSEVYLAENQRKEIYLNDYFNTPHLVDILFYKNPNAATQPTECTVNLDDILSYTSTGQENTDYENAIYTDKTCPTIK